MRHVVMRSSGAGSWARVPGAGRYEVSDGGQVRSLVGKRPRLLKTPLDAHGYPQVNIYRDDRTRWHVQVHKLVALVHIGPRSEVDIRHLDGDKTNNAVSNLAYGTRSENLLDEVRLGKHRQAQKTVCIRDHEFTPENTYLNTSTGRPRRVCRECMRDARRRWKTMQQERRAS